MMKFDKKVPSPDRGNLSFKIDNDIHLKDLACLGLQRSAPHGTMGYHSNFLFKYIKLGL